MSIRTTAGELKRALSRVMVVIDDWQRLDVLRSVLIDSNSVKATDLDVQVMADLATEGPAAPLLVDARGLMCAVDWAENDARVVLDQKADGVSVAVGPARFMFPYEPAEKFPLFPPMEQDSLDLGKEFQRALLHCHPFMSVEETRYYLNGVLLDDDKLVATDGWSMGYHPVGQKTGLRLILPKALVKALLGLPRPQRIAFDAHRNYVLVRTDEATVVGKAIDGRYPDWKVAANAAMDGQFEATFIRSELELALNVARRVSDSSSSVCLAVGADGIAGIGYTHEGISTAIPLHVEAHSALPETDHGPLFCVELNALKALRILNRLRVQDLVALRFQKINEGGPISFLGGRTDAGLILMSLGKKGADKWREHAVRVLRDLREAQA